MPEVVVELQRALRPELKEPLGPIFTDADDLLATAQSPLLAVGDVVTYHLIRAGRVPDVALVDERTERSAVDPEIREGIEGFDREVTASNPQGTLTADLLTALRGAIDREATTLIDVDGEEDLATLPAILLAPRGASVVYGQPGEGMVRVTVDGATTDRARNLLSRMEGDTRRLWAVLDRE
ncbi:MAG: GTP-dependent dephospho-CoA kinase family protein [Haloarculaceae archaeon]